MLEKGGSARNIFCQQILTFCLFARNPCGNDFTWKLSKDGITVCELKELLSNPLLFLTIQQVFHLSFIGLKIDSLCYPQLLVILLSSDRHVNLYSTSQWTSFSFLSTENNKEMGPTFSLPPQSDTDRNVYGKHRLFC